MDDSLEPAEVDLVQGATAIAQKLTAWPDPASFVQGAMPDLNKFNVGADVTSGVQELLADMDKLAAWPDPASFVQGAMPDLNKFNVGADVTSGVQELLADMDKLAPWPDLTSVVQEIASWADVLDQSGEPFVSHGSSVTSGLLLPDLLRRKGKDAGFVLGVALLFYLALALPGVYGRLADLATLAFMAWEAERRLKG